MKRLIDGERKVIRASREFSMFRYDRFKVEAERYDCDTPQIHLTVGTASLCMTDVEALDLINRLQRAISALPSSK